MLKLRPAFAPPGAMAGGPASLALTATLVVIPAKAGIQGNSRGARASWTPAFAGVTEETWDFDEMRLERC
jgi:hypothetical protein